MSPALKQEAPSKPVKSSHIIAEDIWIGVPQQTAYDQWTQYDRWSQMFKKESGSARSKGGGRSRAQEPTIHVSSKIGPSERKWEAETIERLPGKRIAWRAKGGINAEGVTSFHRVDDRLTKLMVEIEYHPKGFVETIGNFLRMQRRRVRKDLRLFKNYIELLGEPTEEGPGELASDSSHHGNRP